MTLPAYDAVLLVSFGGPEGLDDVRPFLANVLRGRSVPAERVAEVARRYESLGGVSPLNGQNRALLAALETELASQGPRLPLYWGNRNWGPFLSETLGQMARDGVRHALAPMVIRIEATTVDEDLRLVVTNDVAPDHGTTESPSTGIGLASQGENARASASGASTSATRCP